MPELHEWTGTSSANEKKDKNVIQKYNAVQKTSIIGIMNDTNSYILFMKSSLISL